MRDSHGTRIGPAGRGTKRRERLAKIRSSLSQREGRGGKENREEGGGNTRKKCEREREDKFLLGHGSSGGTAEELFHS